MNVQIIRNGFTIDELIIADKVEKACSLKPSAMNHKQNARIPMPDIIPVIRWNIDIFAVIGNLYAERCGDKGLS